MGCALETLEIILDYLHREHVKPNYLADYVGAKTGRQKFIIQNNLDDTGCTPECASHKAFGFQTLELTSCSQCLNADEVNDIEYKFMDPY